MGACEGRRVAVSRASELKISSSSASAPSPPLLSYYKGEAVPDPAHRSQLGTDPAHQSDFGLVRRSWADRGGDEDKSEVRSEKIAPNSRVRNPTRNNRSELTGQKSDQKKSLRTHVAMNPM